MPRHRRSQEVNIFNFSFLDILACTVGALAFVLVVVMIVNLDSIPIDLAYRLEQIGADLELYKVEAKQCEIERENFVVAQERMRVLETRRDELDSLWQQAVADAYRCAQELYVANDLVAALREGGAEDDVSRRQKDELVHELGLERAKVLATEAKLQELRVELDGLRHAGTDHAEEPRRVHVGFLITSILCALMLSWIAWVIYKAHKYNQKMRREGWVPKWVRSVDVRRDKGESG